MPTSPPGRLQAPLPTGDALRHLAVIASDVSFAISDCSRDDDPLMWVNPAFERTTGYRSADVLGHNCRFLQGPDTDRATVARIAAGLRSGGTVNETLLNYRADGSTFWNHVVISPIHDAAGTMTHYVGVQSDVTARIEADAARDAALAEARDANGRLSALGAISQALATRLDTDENTLNALPAIVASHFEGWVAVAGLTDRGRLTTVAVAHSDPDRDIASPVITAAARSWLEGRGRTGLGTALRWMNPEAPTALALSERGIADALATVGLTGLQISNGGGMTIVGTPLTARGRTLGLLMIMRDGSDAFDRRDLAAIGDLGVRAGVAVDNARLYTSEHQAALTLQQSLLPRLPELDGYQVAATYLPAEGRAEVGGDWYDVLELHGSQIGVAVGDVMGHDLRAAAAMGQLRSVLRSYAWSGDAPAAVMERLDELVRGLDMAALATCVYAVIDRAEPCAVSYTRAGHPPPLLKHPSGRVEYLDQALTPPVGVASDHRSSTQAVTVFPVGGYLVLYTDGLVERRERDIDQGVRALATVLEAAPPDISAEGMCERIVERLSGGVHEDDICVLVLRRLHT